MIHYKAICKKLITSLLIFSLICCIGLPLFSIEAEAATVTRQYGDVNWDGKIDSRDINLINQHKAAAEIANIKKAHPDWILYGDDYKVADVNCDGVVDSRDLLKVLQYNSAATIPTIRNKHPEWISYLNRYYRYNTTLKLSTKKVNLNLNGAKTCKVSITQNYGRSCYMKFFTSGTVCANVERNGWDKTLKTYTITVRATKAGSFAFIVRLYDTKNKNQIVKSDVVTVNVNKGTSTLTKANALAQKAEKEIGYQGRNSKGTGRGDYTKYGKFTGTNGQYWCASFVSWCVKKAGVSTSVVPKTASTLVMAKKSKSYRKWSASNFYNLKRGDVIFFSRTKSLTYKNGNKAVHHVGIVTSVNKKKGTVTIVEGNTSKDIVKKNTYKPNISSGYLWKNEYFCGYISVK